MKKRVCENCQFFQEAGFAKNGWCNNPQRKESSDMKLVVRRNELACRGSWSNDLFMPRTGEGSASSIVLHDDAFGTATPPARAEEVTFFVNGHREPTRTSGTPEHASSAKPVDVVVGQMPSSNPAADRAPLMNHDNRSAILKARERHRAKQGTVQRHVEPVLLTSNVVDDIDVSSPSFPRSGDRAPIATYSPRPRRTDDVPPVQRNEISREFPTMTSFPEDDERFMTVPEPVAGVDLPRRATSVTTHLKAPDHEFRDDTIVDHGVASYATTRPRDVSPVELSQSAYAEIDVVEDRVGRPFIEADDEPELSAAEFEDEVDNDPIDEIIPIFRQERRRFDFGWRRPGRVQQQPVVVMEETEYEQETWIEETQPELVEEYQRFAEFEQHLDVDDDVVIAPDIPRMCRTCRDFRPADSGDRGWCTNRWAFSHRRMVDSDELPCETSVGVWWLPSDEVWLATADLSAHSQPTPLVDLWLAKTGQDDTESVGERRRKRS